MCGTCDEMLAPDVWSGAGGFSRAAAASKAHHYCAESLRRGTLSLWITDKSPKKKRKRSVFIALFFFKSLPFGFKYRHKTIPLKKKLLNWILMKRLSCNWSKSLRNVFVKCLSSDIKFHQFEKVFLSLKSIFAPLIPHHRVLVLNPAPSLFLRCQTYISGLNFTDLNWNKSFD